MTASGQARADAVRSMLRARSVAVVGASPRPGSFGLRLTTELLRSTADLDVHLVNPRYAEVAGRRCLPSLADVPAPVDLVLLGVGDAALEPELATAAARGDRSAVIFGNAYQPAADGVVPLRERLAETARSASMAMCGAGCMGFVNVGYGLRAIGYLEREPLPRGPVALVTHSGSVFSALLRTRRAVGFSLAVSSGQELVTVTADYLDHALSLPETEVVALVLETVRDAHALRAALATAAARDVPVVLLPVGTSEAGRAMVSAHSGAVAGGTAAWEALADAYGVHLVADLGELLDTLELFTAGRRARPGARGARGATGPAGLAAVLDSGAERALLTDVAAQVRVPFANLSEATLTALSARLDPGLVATNPLDVWGSGADTERLLSDVLTTMAADPAVGAVALAVDLVEEYDGDDSYSRAALGAAERTSLPVVVLSHVPAALDLAAAARLRGAGVPVLEGTRSGLKALGHLLDRVGGPADPPPKPAVADPQRQARWLARLDGGPLSAVESFALAADYGIATVPVRAAASLREAAAAADSVDYPVVLKTDAGVAHKSDVGGVLTGLLDAAALRRGYDDLARRLGPGVLVCGHAAPGTELLLGVVRDPCLGMLVVLGAGGTLAERLPGRAVALPPVTSTAAHRLLERTAVRPLLTRPRGRAPADPGAVAAAVQAASQLAVELGSRLAAFEVNPLVCSAAGAVAVDVLVEAAGRPGAQKMT